MFWKKEIEGWETGMIKGGENVRVVSSSLFVKRGMLLTTSLTLALKYSFNHWSTSSILLNPILGDWLCWFHILTTFYSNKKRRSFFVKKKKKTLILVLNFFKVTFNL